MQDVVIRTPHVPRDPWLDLGVRRHPSSRPCPVGLVLRDRTALDRTKAEASRMRTRTKVPPYPAIKRRATCTRYMGHNQKKARPRCHSTTERPGSVNPPRSPPSPQSTSFSIPSFPAVMSQVIQSAHTRYSSPSSSSFSAPSPPSVMMSGNDSSISPGRRR